MRFKLKKNLSRRILFASFSMMMNDLHISDKLGVQLAVFKGDVNFKSISG